MTEHEPWRVELQVLAFFGRAVKADRGLFSPKHALGALTPRQATERSRGSEVIQLIEQAQHGFV